ncbi:hypothetical protein RUND412_008870 [Rhizina undulata]
MYSGHSSKSPRSPAPGATSNSAKKMTLPVAKAPPSMATPASASKAKKAPVLLPPAKQFLSEDEEDEDEETGDDDSFLDDEEIEEIPTDRDSTGDETEDEEEAEDDFDLEDQVVETDHHTDKIPRKVVSPQYEEVPTDVDEPPRIVTPVVNKHVKPRRENKRLSNTGPLQEFSPRSPLSPQPRSAVKPSTSARKEKDIFAGLRPQAKEAVTLLLTRLSQLEDAESIVLEELLSGVKKLCLDQKLSKLLEQSDEEDEDVQPKAKVKSRGKSKEKEREKEDMAPIPTKTRGKSSAKSETKKPESKEKEHSEPASTSSKFNPASLKVPELKAELKKLGLSTAGLKRDLVERLTEALEKAT